MKYRAIEMELPEDNIYKYDALNRKPVVQFIENFVSTLDGPFVLALDSPWGTGKTTVIRLLQASLAMNQSPCIYFNAWKIDYASDPLVALVSALDEIEPKNPIIGTRFQSHMTSVKRLTTSVAKHGAIAAVKAATFGALDLDSSIEQVTADMAGNLTNDLVESFKKEKASLEKLRGELEKAIGELSNDSADKPLIFFIDELDRCRPSFAIEMLERIKHLFDVERLIFVLSIDKHQLEAAIGAVYGEKFDSSEYLRRFFDMEFRLPEPDSKRFAHAQIHRFGLDEYFGERKRHDQTRNDGDHLIETITELAKVFRLSLRAIERVMARVALVCSQIPVNHYLDPILVAFLVILRIKNIELFEDIASDNASSSQVMDYIRTLPGGDEFAFSHFGLIIETYLLTGDGNNDRKMKKIAELKALAKEAFPNDSHAVKIVHMMQFIPSGSSMRHYFSTSGVASKVEMASVLDR